jgi:hypothetical protein
MKKSVVMSMALLLFMTIGSIKSNAQETKKDIKSEKKALRKLEGTKVNVLAKDHFVANFGNLPDVQWKRTVNFDEAAFTKNGKKMKAWYDGDANLVGITSNVTFADVPVAGQKEIKAKYKDYTIGSVVFYDDSEANETDMMLYDMQFDDADNYFVELVKGSDKIVLMVNPEGNVSFFKKL